MGRKKKDAGVCPENAVQNEVVNNDADIEKDQQNTQEKEAKKSFEQNQNKTAPQNKQISDEDLTEALKACKNQEDAEALYADTDYFVENQQDSGTVIDYRQDVVQETVDKLKQSENLWQERGITKEHTDAELENMYLFANDATKSVWSPKSENRGSHTSPSLEEQNNSGRHKCARDVDAQEYRAVQVAVEQNEKNGFFEGEDGEKFDAEQIKAQDRLEYGLAARDVQTQQADKSIAGATSVRKDDAFDINLDTSLIQMHANYKYQGSDDYVFSDSEWALRCNRTRAQLNMHSTKMLSNLVTRKCLCCGEKHVAKTEYPYSNDPVWGFYDSSAEKHYPVCLYCLQFYYELLKKKYPDASEQENIESMCRVLDIYFWPELADKICTDTQYLSTAVMQPLTKFLTDHKWIVYYREIRRYDQLKNARYTDYVHNRLNLITTDLIECRYVDDVVIQITEELKNVGAFVNEDTKESVAALCIDIMKDKMPDFYENTRLKFRADRLRLTLEGDLNRYRRDNIDLTPSLQPLEQVRRKADKVGDVAKQPIIYRKMSEQALANRAEVIRVFHTDPFAGEKIEDREQMYSDLITMTDDAMSDDLVKQKAAIEIVRAFKRIDKISEAIRLMQLSTESMVENEKSLKMLTEQKTKETAVVTALSKDNGFTERYAQSKSRGSGTLSAVIRDMADYHYDPGAVNRFDIKTSEAIKQVSDISAQSIFDQLKLQESDYASMVSEQAAELKRLREKLESTQEELRVYKEKHLKQQLMEELRAELIAKHIDPDDVEKLVNEEYQITTRGFQSDAEEARLEQEKVRREIELEAKRQLAEKESDGERS